MTNTTPLATAYVAATNAHDADAFRSLFADDAIVNDNGREFRGIDAIEHWSRQEIFAVDVTLDVLDSAESDGETVVTTKVNGTFDKTGLPDPLLINHHISQRNGKIAGLACKLVK